MARLRAGLAAVVATSLLAACVPTRRGPTTTSVIRSTQTITAPPSTPQPSFTPPPARSVAPLPPGAAPARGEVEKRCPYIASSPRYYTDPRTNVADIIGSHVLRTTVLTTSDPVGCRFYFYAGPFQAIADIVPRTFDSARAAHDALVRTGQAGTDAAGVSGLVPGVDAVLYRTAFFGPDGERDWACAFASGKLLVVVHSQRDDTSYSVRRLAAAIAPRFG